MMTRHRTVKALSLPELRALLERFGLTQEVRKPRPVNDGASRQAALAQAVERLSQEALRETAQALDRAR